MSTFGGVGTVFRLTKRVAASVSQNLSSSHALKGCPDLAEALTEENMLDLRLFLPHFLAWDLHQVQRAAPAESTAARYLGRTGALQWPGLALSESGETNQHLLGALSYNDSRAFVVGATAAAPIEPTVHTVTLEATVRRCWNNSVEARESMMLPRRARSCSGRLSALPSRELSARQWGNS